MTDVLQMIGGAMRAEADALRTVSQNIANAQTVAYRRQVPVTQVQFESLLSSSTPAAKIPTAEFRAEVDLTTATLKRTSEPLNVALDGPGFFVVQSASGPLLTRRGDFHVAPDGTLVAFSGAPVMGEKGEIQVGAEVPTIGSDGVVSVKGTPIEQLRIVSVGPHAPLEALGDGTYRAAPEAIEEGARAAVHQGFLEASNVTPINEMVQMMEIVRRFEAEQKFARAFDGMLEKAISELGRVG